MAGKGFGVTEADKLVEQVVKFCLEPSPEPLDAIFNSLNSRRTAKQYQQLNQKVLWGSVAAIRADIETLSWFCSYLSSEINRTEDNNNPRHPIQDLAKILITAGMRPLDDFMPYPGCRIVIMNTKKFEALPDVVKTAVKEAFEVIQRTSEEVQRTNDVLLEELVVEG